MKKLKWVGGAQYKNKASTKKRRKVITGLKNEKRTKTNQERV